MGNILNVAKKEFSDLMMNRFVIVVLCVFILVLLLDLYRNYDVILDSKTNSNIHVEPFSMMGFLSELIVALTGYGSLLGVAIGYSSMSAEKQSGVLNTLVSKPLYRDTVINGKLLGSTAFLLCILTFTTVIYTAGLLFLYGNSLGPIFMNYLVRLPIVILISLLYIIIFYALTMLLSVLIKDNIFALFFSVLAWLLITDVFYGNDFIDSIAYTINGSIVNELGLSNFIADFFPSANIMRIVWYCSDYLNVIQTNGLELLKLSLYVVITIISGYIAFIRRDVA